MAKLLTVTNIPNQHYDEVILIVDLFVIRGFATIETSMGSAGFTNDDPLPQIVLSSIKKKGVAADHS